MLGSCAHRCVPVDAGTWGFCGNQIRLVLSLSQRGVADGHRANTDACRVEYGVGDGGRNGDNGSFPAAGRIEIGSVEKMDIEFGNVFESWYRIFAEPAIKDLAVLEVDLFSQGRAQTHNDAPFDL